MTDKVEPTTSPDDAKPISQWRGLIQATASPIKLFALIVLVCNTVFGIASAVSTSENFVYTLHTFLAVVASFVLMAIWRPRSFYSPAELKALLELEANTGQRIFPESRPWAMTAAFACGLALYAVYQLVTR